MVKDPLQLPDDLPVPEDDGAADHLAGTALPAVTLRASDGTSVRLDELEGRTVVFAYPRTGRPGEPSLGGDEEWDAIPGARGCTPQACSFRDELIQRSITSDERRDSPPPFASRPLRWTGSPCSSASRCSYATA